MSYLTEYELDELIKLASPRIRPQIQRLLAELRELREQAAEREFMHAQEIGG